MEDLGRVPKVATAETATEQNNSVSCDSTDDYPKLQAKFELYELYDPEEHGLVPLLEDRTKVAAIPTKVENFPAIARRNDDMLATSSLKA